jgi:hypothetical protein
MQIIVNIIKVHSLMHFGSRVMLVVMNAYALFIPAITIYGA